MRARKRIPELIKQPDVDLQNQVAKILGVTPFDDKVLSLTPIQIEWYVQINVDPKVIDNTFVDPDFETRKKEILGG